MPEDKLLAEYKPRPQTRAAVYTETVCAICSATLWFFSMRVSRFAALYQLAAVGFLVAFLFLLTRYTFVDFTYAVVLVGGIPMLRVAQKQGKRLSLPVEIPLADILSIDTLRRGETPPQYPEDIGNAPRGFRCTVTMLPPVLCAVRARGEGYGKIRVVMEYDEAFTAALTAYTEQYKNAVN